MSYRLDVVADSFGERVANGLRFATRAEALAYGCDLASRWTAVREFWPAETDDPITHRWDGTLQEVTS